MCFFVIFGNCNKNEYTGDPFRFRIMSIKETSQKSSWSLLLQSGNRDGPTRNRHFVRFSFICTKSLLDLRVLSSNQVQEAQTTREAASVGQTLQFMTKPSDKVLQYDPFLRGVDHAKHLAGHFNIPDTLLVSRPVMLRKQRPPETAR